MPANTPNRGYPYPLPADPVDIPGDMQRLAEAIDDDLETIQPQVAPRPYAQIANFQVQDVPQTFQTPLIFDQVEIDNAGFSNLASLPDRLTLPNSGLYWIHGEVGVPELQNTTVDVRIILVLTVEHTSLFVPFTISESLIGRDTGGSVPLGTYNVTGLLDASQFAFDPPVKLSTSHNSEQNGTIVPIQSAKLSAYQIAL